MNTKCKDNLNTEFILRELSSMRCIVYIGDLAGSEQSKDDTSTSDGEKKGKKENNHL